MSWKSEAKEITQQRYGNYCNKCRENNLPILPYHLYQKISNENILGKELDSNNYGKFKVLEFVEMTRKASYYKIKFINTGYEKVVNYYQIKQGAVRDNSLPFKQSDETMKHYRPQYGENNDKPTNSTKL